jgi:hypothetical protein
MMFVATLSLKKEELTEEFSLVFAVLTLTVGRGSRSSLCGDGSPSGWLASLAKGSISLR